jgi:hypothetical protein
MSNQRCTSVLVKKKWQSNFIATSFGYVKSQIYITKNQEKQLSALQAQLRYKFILQRTKKNEFRQYHFYCLNSGSKRYFKYPRNY